MSEYISFQSADLRPHYSGISWCLMTNR